MMEIGTRLREERSRLQSSQAEFAAACGATKNTQSNYERGKRAPDAVYLLHAAAQGVDVLYVVTGNRADPAALERWPVGTHPFADMTGEEAYLLGNYRACADANKQALLEASAVLANPPPKRTGA